MRDSCLDHQIDPLVWLEWLVQEKLKPRNIAIQGWESRDGAVEPLATGSTSKLSGDDVNRTGLTKRGITDKDISLASGRIHPYVVRTPLVRGESLSKALNTNVFLKLETMQPTGSFKLRGAANAISLLMDESGPRHLVCCSTGNHGRAVAYMARALKLTATIFVPENVPDYKRRRIEELGASVVVAGRSQDAAQAEVERVIRDESMCEIPPFDCDQIISGQGTVGLEITQDCPGVRTVVVPLSGGGLAGGVAVAVKAFDPSIRIVAATLEQGAAMAESIRVGHPVRVPEAPTIAEALSGGIGDANRLTFNLCAELIDEVVRVPEVAIIGAMRRLYFDQGLVTEGGGAIAVAALSMMDDSDGDVAAVITGNNIEPQSFLELMNGRSV